MVDLITVLFEGVDTLFCTELPDLNNIEILTRINVDDVYLDSSITAARHKVFIVRTEVNGDDPGGVARHGAQWCGIADVIQLHVSII